MKPPARKAKNGTQETIPPAWLAKKATFAVNKTAERHVRCLNTLKRIAKIAANPKNSNDGTFMGISRSSRRRRRLETDRTGMGLGQSSEVE